MNEQTLDEKIKLLKQKTKGFNPQAIAIVSEWEDKLARLNAQAEWLSHPNTKELLTIALEQVSSIGEILGEREDLSVEERNKLFAQKKAHLVYVNILSADPKSQIQSIENSVDYELKTEE